MIVKRISNLFKRYGAFGLGFISPLVICTVPSAPLGAFLGANRMRLFIYEPSS
jgi:hypothetical protein